MDLKAEIAASLSSHLLKKEEEALRKGEVGGGDIELKETLEEAEREPTSAVGLQASLAATRLLERSGQGLLAKRLDSINEEEQMARQVTKETKAAALKAKKARKKDPSPPRPLLPAERREEVALPAQMPATMHIQNMEQHARRAREVELYAAQIERPDKPTTDLVINTPTAPETLAYCNRFKESRVFVERYMQTLSAQDALSLQKMPVFSRQVLQTFLRERDPRTPYERDCCNLDREPQHGEPAIRCVAHRLSEDMGVRGFRLRELLFPEQIVAINHTLEVEGGDPRRHLYAVPEMCFLCHVFLTNQACLDQKNRKDEGGGEIIMIANRFIVTFGSEGEYDLRRLIVSDNVAMGILGPFPLWSESHYTLCTVKPSNLRGFAERDVMVFRLSREPSELIASLAKSDSTRSTPTAAAFDTTKRRR